MRADFLLSCNKKRGRPKEGWTQQDAARQLGISQATVSNCLRIAKVTEAFPALAKYKGTDVLRFLRLVKKVGREDLGVDEFLHLVDGEETILEMWHIVFGNKEVTDD